MARQGTIEVYTGSGWKEIGIFDAADISKDYVSVEAASVDAYLNVVSPSDADIPPLEIYTANNQWQSILSVSNGIEVTTSLGGESATMTVYEYDSPDAQTPINTTSFALADGTSIYPLAGFSFADGNDFQFEIQSDNSNASDGIRIEDIKITYAG